MRSCETLQSAVGRVPLRPTRCARRPTNPRPDRKLPHDARTRAWASASQLRVAQEDYAREVETVRALVFTAIYDCTALPQLKSGTLTQAAPRGHRAGAPVRRVAGRRFERQRHDPLDLRISNGPWRARARPSTHLTRNRCRHLPTVSSSRRSSRATRRLAFPETHSSTTRARCASACAVLFRLTSDSPD